MILQKKQKKGFTLIELLVVIAIIAILAAILFPVFSRAREQARKTACLSNLKQLGTALTMYVQDWDETLPFWRTGCQNDPNYPWGGLFWTEQLMPYVKNQDVFRCPSAMQEWQFMADCYPGTCGRPQNNIRCNYGYNDIIMNGYEGSHRLARLVAPAETVVIADCWESMLSPWATTAEGIAVKIALANYDLQTGKDMVCCPLPIRLTVPLDEALDRHARHTSGAIIVFADGHAKWYRGDQIRPRLYGGQLRMNAEELTR